MVVALGNGLKEFILNRWDLTWDANYDGAITVSDVSIWLKWIYFAPGDGLIWFLMQFNGTRTFFELSEQSYGNLFSGIVSAPLIAFLGMFGLIFIALCLDGLTKG